MTRLPTVGGDSESWGTVLNDYLTKNVTHHYTLSVAAVVGETDFVLDKDASGMLAGGSYVAIGAMTTKCEIRRVLSVSGDTVTVGGPIGPVRYAHDAGEFVWVLQSFYVPLEWFGAKVADSTNWTGYEALKAAAIEWNLSPATFGIDGRDQSYYVNRTVFFGDGMAVRNLRVLGYASAGWAYDPNQGDDWLGNAGHFLAMLPGQFTTVTSVDSGANTVTTAGSIGSDVFTDCWFYPAQGATLPGGITEGKRYYVKTNPSGNVYTLSETYGAGTLDITSAGTGTIYVVSSGMARMQWDKVRFDGQLIQGLNGLLAFTQQPSVAHSLRIESFPGEAGGLMTSAQQGDYYTLMITHCYVGMRLGSSGTDLAQFLYIVGSNVESCDIGVIAHGARDIRFVGGHWETIGVYNKRNPCIVGNAGVSAGTFTLTFNSEVTSPINHNANAATIRGALENLTSISPGDVVVTDVNGGLPGGYVRIDFAGQYRGKYMGSSLITIQNTLTGGTYSINNNNPDASAFRMPSTSQTMGISFHGGVFTGPVVLPDGTSSAFLTNLGYDTDDYLIEGLVSTGVTGYVVLDTPRNISIGWDTSDNTPRGVDGTATFISAPGRNVTHGGYPWQLQGAATGWVGFQTFNQRLVVRDGASIAVGNTGTAYKAQGMGAAASTTDGGTIAHGLGVTPDVVICTPSVAGEMVTVTSKDATNITVAIKKNDGTAGTTQTVYWQAFDL